MGNELNTLDYLVVKHRDGFEGTLMYGKPLTSLTREELMAVLLDMNRYLISTQLEHRRRISVLMGDA